jgi:hypothetical protein
MYGGISWAWLISACRRLDTVQESRIRPRWLHFFYFRQCRSAGHPLRARFLFSLIRFSGPSSFAGWYPSGRARNHGEFTRTSKNDSHTPPLVQGLSRTGGHLPLQHFNNKLLHAFITMRKTDNMPLDASRTPCPNCPQKANPRSPPLLGFACPRDRSMETIFVVRRQGDVEDSMRGQKTVETGQTVDSCLSWWMTRRSWKQLQSVTDFPLALVGIVNPR